MPRQKQGLKLTDDIRKHQIIHFFSIGSTQLLISGVKFLLWDGKHWWTKLGQSPSSNHAYSVCKGSTHTHIHTNKCDSRRSCRRSHWLITTLESEQALKTKLNLFSSSSETSKWCGLRVPNMTAAMLWMEHWLMWRHIGAEDDHKSGLTTVFSADRLDWLCASWTHYPTYTTLLHCCSKFLLRLGFYHLPWVQIHKTLHMLLYNRGAMTRITDVVMRFGLSITQYHAGKVRNEAVGLIMFGLNGSLLCYNGSTSSGNSLGYKTNEHFYSSIRKKNQAQGWIL